MVKDHFNVWAYVSVGEQSFNYRVVVSWDAFGFQHQIETDVCTVTEMKKNH